MGKDIPKASELARVADENFKTYTKMVKYIRNLKMLDIHKREISKKLYNMYTNLTKKQTNMESYVVNPKEFCDKICGDYVKSTPVAMVYLEAIKKLTLVIAVLCLICDVFLKKPLVNEYFIHILIGIFGVSMILTYLKLYRVKKYGLDEESLGYKIVYNVVALIMIVPMFLVKDVIRENEIISILNIGIICIILFFICTVITYYFQNKINKQRKSYKSII